jgi:hypothetical protein
MQCVPGTLSSRGLALSFLVLLGSALQPRIYECIRAFELSMQAVSNSPQFLQHLRFICAKGMGGAARESVDLARPPSGYNPHLSYSQHPAFPFILGASVALCDE